MKKKINRKILWLLLVFLVSGICSVVKAGQYNVYTPITYKQIHVMQTPKNAKIQGEAIELLVDYSGSMEKWIEVAKETLIFILPKLPDSSAVALRVFGEEDSLNSYSYTDACKTSRLVVYFKKNNESRLIKALEETQIGGETPIEFALRQTVTKDLKGLTILTSDKKKAPVQKKKIILVTDGGETCGGDPCAYIRSIIYNNKDLQIDVVQLGSDTFLNCLSSMTGGTFYRVDGSREKFEEAFEDAFNVPRGTVNAGKNGVRNIPQNVKIKYESQPNNYTQRNSQTQTQNQTSKPSSGYKFIKY